MLLQTKILTDTRRILLGRNPCQAKFSGGGEYGGNILYRNMNQDFNWITFYISGRRDFREEVRKKLEHSELPYMPGFIEETSEERSHDLYWVKEGTPLRTFKEAIGGKLIWKYRLRFFKKQEEFLSSEALGQSEFSDRERELINQMRKAS
jgi:hypothetical protein